MSMNTAEDYRRVGLAVLEGEPWDTLHRLQRRGWQVSYIGVACILVCRSFYNPRAGRITLAVFPDGKITVADNGHSTRR